MINRVARLPDMPYNEKYHVQTENVPIPIPQIPVVVSTGELPIGECTGIPGVFNAWNKGARDLVIFGFGAKRPVFQLLAAAKIKELQDARDKTVGVQGIQTAGAEAAEMILKRGAGLLPDRDYKFVTIGANTAAMAALRAGRIDMLPLFPPFTYAAEKLGLSVVADEGTYIPAYVTGAYIVNRRWAEKNREFFVRFLMAVIETGQWFKDAAHEKEVVAWIAGHMPSGSADKLDLPTAQRIYDFYIRDDRLAFDGYAPESSVRATLSILKERGVITDSQIPPLGQVVDFSYLNAARQQLGLEPLPEYSRN